MMGIASWAYKSWKYRDPDVLHDPDGRGDGVEHLHGWVLL